MKNMKYITPNIYVKRLEIESVMQTLSSGGEDNGDGKSEVRSYTHIIDDDGDSDDYFL